MDNTRNLEHTHLNKKSFLLSLIRHALPADRFKCLMCKRSTGLEKYFARITIKSCLSAFFLVPSKEIHYLTINLVIFVALTIFICQSEIYQEVLQHE